MPMEDPMLNPASIVVVDDDLLALNLLDELIVGFSGSHVAAFTEPEKALAWCQTRDPDVIITDYQMPGMDGLELLKRLRAEVRTRDVPIMMVTALDDRELRQRALELGANDFLSKPLHAAEVTARLRNMILIRQAHQALAVRGQELAMQVRLATTALAAREKEVIFRLCRAVTFRDWESGAHILRIAHYARIIARRLELPVSRQESIFLAAPMHDVGKIGVPDHILMKPGRLDDDEFAIMKQHAVIGHGILSDSKSELLQLAAEIALNHHERIDGRGYPNGLQGEDIPLSSRIVAIADVFDALVSLRPYKAAWEVGAALATLKAGIGTQFDRKCLTAFLNGLDEILEARTHFRDDESNDNVMEQLAKAGGEAPESRLIHAASET